MANRASITIYHSCDAPATQTLHHFKKGTLKRPRSNQDIHLPLPTEKVNIPRRHGTLETVLRCSAPYCKDCAATEYEGNELTLTVAKSHGITGVNLRPSRTAKTAAERLQDGLERGKWIFSRETSLLSAITQELSDRTQRFASFHPQAASFVRVLAFLRGVPMEVEISDSTPRGNYFEASEGKGAEDVPGLPLADNMPVGAFYGDFGKPTGSRGEEDALGDQQVARHRSSEEVVKPGQKGGEEDIGFPRLMPGSLRGSTSLRHHRQNVRTWPADGALQRRATQVAALAGGSWPLKQPPQQRYHHHHHRQNGRIPPTTNNPGPFPQHPSRWQTITPTTTATGLQLLPPRPRDPNIMPTPPIAGGASAAFAEDLALNFANGLAADKRLLEDAGLVAQGRRKKVRV
ncbi:hypothetical protein KC332_g10960 [Hortaea werneckii]|nr:hypothetical protein KC358_g3732 [Hortaea werneckii]KAI6846612.1 hypothetical protein KC350_g3832 [Hortaea werneckii]KAI6940323.1 hypothetical protein KC341_g3595 [Hortaea werneckii]KAI6944515.1 hypothetical protein KC348_g3946 [Hortaea werneckii]KAI6975912.1 hypothetical protein KC321_g4293 [Hortaea werneckii]